MLALLVAIQWVIQYVLHCFLQVWQRITHTPVWTINEKNFSKDSLRKSLKIIWLMPVTFKYICSIYTTVILWLDFSVCEKAQRCSEIVLRALYFKHGPFTKCFIFYICCFLLVYHIHISYAFIRCHWGECVQLICFSVHTRNLYVRANLPKHIVLHD